MIVRLAHRAFHACAEPRVVIPASVFGCAVFTLFMLLSLEKAARNLGHLFGAH